ncbi:serine hydrolase [Phenylobacterium sp.]|uniref:serine hydrolase n=1 Tax=Phenylobacterium sp. TaxID=1871053 RepID=UPI002EDB4E65
MRQCCDLFAAMLLGLSCLVAAPAWAQAGKVDAFVQAQMADRKIPGIAIAVVRDGKIVHAKGYGLANVELNVPAAPETIFQSGSVGKQFTAALAMMLVEEEKIALDDRVSKYIPEAPPTWKAMTVRHLLTQTSGISGAEYDKAIDLRRDYTEDQLIAEIVKLPLDFEPGEKWRYSNPGYVTLGILIGRASGKFYGDLLSEKIFAPLGMTTARVISEADIVQNRADGYRLVDGKLENQQWVAPRLNTTADGSLYLTVLDMAKWDAALYTERILKRASLDQMWSPARLRNGALVSDYGFAWFLGQRKGARFVRHGGAWQGFTSDIVRYPERKLTVIVLANLARAEPGALGNQIVGVYEPDLAPPPRVRRTAVPIDPRLFDAYAGRYELEPDFFVVITRDGDRLFAQATGQSRFELLPQSGTAFFANVADIVVTFAKDRSGAVTHFTLRQDGQDRVAKRVR